MSATRCDSNMMKSFLILSHLLVREIPGQFVLRGYPLMTSCAEGGMVGSRKSDVCKIFDDKGGRGG